MLISMRMPMIFMFIGVGPVVAVRPLGKMNEGASRGACRGKTKSYGKRCGVASQMDEAILLTRWRSTIGDEVPQWKRPETASTGVVIGVFGRMSNASYHALILLVVVLNWFLSFRILIL